MELLEGTPHMGHWVYSGTANCSNITNIVTVNVTDGLGRFFSETANYTVIVESCGNGICDCQENVSGDCSQDCNTSVTQVSPNNGHSSGYKTQTFVCSATSGKGLASMALHIWGISGSATMPVMMLLYTNIKTVSGYAATESWGYTFASLGTYLWNCLANDTEGDSDWGDRNYTLTITSGGGGSTECPGEWVCGAWGQCTATGTQRRSCDCRCRSGSGVPQCDSSDKPDESRSCDCNSDSDCSAADECKEAYCNSENRCDRRNKDDGSSCSDGDPCTENDACLDGSCHPGPQKDRSDGNECTSDICTATGSCSNPPDDTRTCDDGDDCTSGDKCSGGSCTGTDICECRDDSDCDDGKDNTDDKCVNNRCEHERRGEEPPVENVTEELTLTGAQPNWTAPVEYTEENYTMDITVNPSSEAYTPGQRLESVVVRIFDSEGNEVDGANVSGRLESVSPRELVFSGPGAYVSELGYTISNDELSLIRIVVTALIDEQGISETKYLLVRAKEYFYLIAKKPEYDDAAPGQRIAFEAEIDKVNPNDVVSTKSVILIDERTGSELEMGDTGQDLYSTSLKLPKNAYETAYFLVVATADVNGVERQNAYREVLGKTDALYLKFDKSRQTPDKGLFALEVRYIDELGELLDPSVQELAAKITSYPSGRVQELILIRDGDVFTGKYNKKESDTSARILVWDSYDNSGYANLPPEFFPQRGILGGIPLEYIGAAVILIAGAFAVLKMRGNIAQRKAVAKMERDALEQRTEELENLIKRTKADFYKKSITEEQANASIKDYEAELAKIKAKLGK